MRKVLITGAGGFVGSHLMDYFGAVGFDNFLTGRRENRYDVLELDITDRQKLYALANELEPDVVIHCAASYSDPDKWHRDTDTNVSGCINAALVARHHGAHLVYFQTILPPVSSYAISKIAGEQYLRLSGVPLTVLRLANVYGPRNLSGPIPVFYKRLSRSEPCTIVNTTRDMVYIADLVTAVGDVVEFNLTGTFDVCTGVQTPIYEMFNLVGTAMGLEKTLVDVQEPATDDVQGSVSPSNAIPLWKPSVSLRDGIRRTVASYEAEGIAETYTHLRMKG